VSNPWSGGLALRARWWWGARGIAKKLGRGNRALLNTQGRLVRQTDLRTRNGDVETLTFNRSNQAAPTYEIVSPEGRRSRAVLDQLARPVRLELPGTVPTELGYDSAGRLSTVRRGSRQTTLNCFATADHRNGYLESEVDALPQSVSFDRDARGRVLSQSLPGTSSTTFAWDENSNLIAAGPRDASACEPDRERLTRA